ncbi:MAG: hypothetical protein GXP44_01500 [bacterium]|nr:hypothetical protein [bacterium]
MVTLTRKSITETKIAKQSVVVLPLEQWAEIERDLEDVEMMRSSIFTKKIEAARKEKTVYSSKQVKEKLGL